MGWREGTGGVKVLYESCLLSLSREGSIARLFGISNSIPRIRYVSRCHTRLMYVSEYVVICIQDNAILKFWLMVMGVS